MSNAPESDNRSSFRDDGIDNVAAQWVARRDRGLTSDEQDEFLQWLAEDPRHGDSLARHQRGWSELAMLALWSPEHGASPNPDLLRPVRPAHERRRTLVRWVGPLVLAAAAIVVLLVRPVPVSAPRTSLVADSDHHQRTLDDGSHIAMDKGARLDVAYTPSDRRIQLHAGEAMFTVAKNPRRPFIVEAHGVEVRAVGTAFRVNLQSGGVEVLVTEGRVQVTRERGDTGAEVRAGQQLVVPFAGPVPTASPAPVAELAHPMRWQPRMLEFDGTPLAEVVLEFNRHNAVQLVLGDEELRSLPVGASFRPDNVEAFVRLLEASFRIEAEREGTTIVLRRRR